MARRPSVPTTAPRKASSAGDLQNGIGRLQKRITELEDFDPGTMTQGYPPNLKALSTSIQTSLARVFGDGTADYDRFKSSATLAYSPRLIFSGMPPTPLTEHIKGVSINKERSLAQLREAVRTLEEDLLEISSSREGILSLVQNVISNKIFLVHGHDVAARESMARFLEKLELEAIILHEKPDQGMTIIEKFESYASQVGFAVVLLTPDDLGGVASGTAEHLRARQNVIFELGYFVGKLGRGKACLVRKGNIEIPTDLAGVVYTDMDVADAWKIRLVKELKAAGLKFDANKVWE